MPLIPAPSSVQAFAPASPPRTAVRSGGAEDGGLIGWGRGRYSDQMVFPDTYAIPLPLISLRGPTSSLIPAPSSAQAIDSSEQLFLPYMCASMD